MDAIDKDWIRARLTGRHGEQRDLAAAMQISADKLAKILSGTRRITAGEAARAFAFFNREPGFGEAPAFYAPAQVQPVKNRATFLAVARLIAPLVSNPEMWVLNRAVPAAGLLPGDVLVVELGNTATTNDLVLVSLAAPDSNGRQTDVRRYLPPHLVSADVTDPRPVLPCDSDQSIAVIATVRGCLRSQALVPERA